MTIEAEKLYEQRLNRINAAAEGKEPDIVPVFVLMGEWAVGHAGKKIKEVFEKGIDEEIKIFEKVFDDIYFDGVTRANLSRDLKMYDSLGGSHLFYSRDEVTMQHKEYVFMKEDEYPLLIKNPMEYLVNIDCGRKFPSLNKPYPENYIALKEALDSSLAQNKKNGMIAQHFKNKYGMPTLQQGPPWIMPLDVILDYLRGFTGTMMDLRRRPQEVIKATEVLTDVVIEKTSFGKTKLDFAYMPMHIPTYLSAKQFERFYWPSFNKIICKINEMGGKALMFIEGNWEHLYEFLNQLPNNKNVAILDMEDVFKAKKEIGKNVAVAGGINLSMLKNIPIQENLDYCKKLIDECAPGGGFMASNNRILISPDDANGEKLNAVTEFIHTYGKY